MARNKFNLLNNRKKIMLVVITLLLLGGIGSAYVFVSNSSIAGTSKVEVVKEKEVTVGKDENKEKDTEENQAKDENKEGTKDMESEVKADETVATETSSTEEHKTETKVEDKKSENTSSNITSKPSGITSSNNTTSNSSNSGSSSSTTTESKPSHTHNWVEVTSTVNHAEEGHWENVCIKDAWVEEVPVYVEDERYICNGCGKDITSDPDTHMYEALVSGNTKCGGYHSEWKKVQTGTNKINHEAVYENKWVVDKSAWTETVTTGYKCSCGATK